MPRKKSEYMVELESDNRIPVLTGTLDGNVIQVWCPFCHEYHRHFWPDGDPRMNHHRSAHCRSQYSPYHWTGYFIALAPENNEKNKRETSPAKENKYAQV